MYTVCTDIHACIGVEVLKSINFSKTKIYTNIDTIEMVVAKLSILKDYSCLRLRNVFWETSPICIQFKCHQPFQKGEINN